MGSPTPDLLALADGCVAHIVADLAAGASSVLAPILAAYGVSIDTTESPDDEGGLTGIMLGERANLPYGVSVEVNVDEAEWELSPFAAPNLWRQDYFLPLLVYWKDPVEVAGKLEGKQRTLRRLMAALAHGMQSLFSPEHLPALYGSWEVGGGRLLHPRCEVVVAASRDKDRIKRHQVLCHSELEFSGYVTYSSV